MRRRSRASIRWLVVGALLGALQASVPVWWQKGWPRQRVRSIAEAELLPQLALLLMPDEPIAELLRRFPSPAGWGGNYLEPDLSAYGVLKDENAALFVEYDGYWGHAEKEGIKRDELKNAALLAYAPQGSYVIRISPHAQSIRLDGNILQVPVDTWPNGDLQPLYQAVVSVLRQVQMQLSEVLHPNLIQRWQALTGSSGGVRLEAAGVRFAEQATAALGFNTSAEIQAYLGEHGFCQRDAARILGGVSSRKVSIECALEPALCFFFDLGVNKTQVAKAVAGFPQILGLSIEQNLKPTVQWLLDLGLSEAQVAKAVARFPHILGYSIEQNLKPTVQWLLDLGPSTAQVAKAVAGFPPILGLSIEQNLKPTVKWLLDLGLNEVQVAKAVAAHPPMLWLSIEQNLKPTVQWLLDLGLSEAQVAKAVARFPHILGYSIEQNLKPTVQWLLDLGPSTAQVAKAVAGFPPILGLSIEQNLKPTVKWLLDLGLSEAQVAKAVARSPPILSLSIEENLAPTVQWLLDLGLSQAQVAKAVAGKPQILGYSIEENLKPTVQWLVDLGLSQAEVSQAVASFSPIIGLSITNLQSKLTLLKIYFQNGGAARLVAICPRILSYSIKRLEGRLKVLDAKDKTDKLTQAMTLSEEDFMRRFG